MHPAIRIVNCLLLIMMLASGIPLAFFISLGVTLLLLAWRYRQDSLPDITAAWRLRWLFASILVLYILFPPIAEVGWLAALAAAFLEAGLRIGALIAIVMLVQTLFAMTERQHVIAGLLWLLKPLTVIGIPVERFTLRLMLVMEVVPQAQALLKQQDRNENVADGRIARAGKRLTSAYARVIEAAEREPHDMIDVPVLPPPLLHEWLSPFLLTGLLLGVSLAV